MTGRDLAGRRLGGFELVEPLGTGAFATVWRARQLRLGRDVAVKVLDPVVARNPESARRFEREGRSAASLDHPNIVPVYEAGEDDGLVFLAMRLVDGETLEGLLERDGPIGVDRTVDVLASVADALDHAHSRELTHRDVKPSNILLGDERVWLADFGIAATAQEIGRYTMGSIGTAEYMAPEQAAGGDLDHRADLYALGCVVFHCLTGSPPFTGDELMPVLMAHVNDPVPTVDDPPLAAFFERALAKDPADRYQSGRELIDALRAAGGDGGARPTIVASAEPARPAWPYAAVGAVLALVIGAVGFFVFAGGGGDPDEADVANVEQVPTTTPVAGVTTPASAPPSTAAGDDADDSDDDATDESSGVTTAPPNTDAPAPVVPDGLAIVSTNDSLASLNPHTNFGVSGILSDLVYPTLVTVEPDFSLRPNVAVDLPELVSADPLTVRWTLRDDAVWADGTPITSSDVQATFEYLTSGAANITGTYFYERIATFTADTETQFTVTFTEPIGAWRLLFSTTHPLIQKAAYDAHIASGAPLTDFLQEDQLFSGGPYHVVGFEPGERISLRYNDRWWGDPPELDRVTFRRYESIDDQIDALRTGDVDLTYVRLPAAGQVVEARAIEGVTVETGESDSQFELGFNTLRTPLDDLDVRRAIAHAIDRNALAAVLVQPVTGAAEAPLDSLLYYPRHPEYRTPFATYGDTAEAARLLDAAGWTVGDGGMRSKDGTPLTVRLMYRTATVDLINTQGQAQAIRDQLLPLGVTVELEGTTNTDYLQRRQIGDFDLRLDLTTTNTDPTAIILRFSTDWCPSTVEGCDGNPLGANFGGYSNPDVDALMAQTAVEADIEARAELFHQIDELLAADVPTLPLYEGPAFVAHVSDLSQVEVLSARGGPLSRYDEWTYVTALE